MCFLSDHHYADHHFGGVLCVLAAMSGHAALYRTPGEQEHGKVYPSVPTSQVQTRATRC